MEDQNVLDWIRKLMDEEHELLKKEEREGASEANRERRRNLEEYLDQCWDLLRQRRAKRMAGLDPESASVREVGMVEHYQQSRDNSGSLGSCSTCSMWLVGGWTMVVQSDRGFQAKAATRKSLEEVAEVPVSLVSPPPTSRSRLAWTERAPGTDQTNSTVGLSYALTPVAFASRSAKPKPSRLLSMRTVVTTRPADSATALWARATA